MFKRKSIAFVVLLLAVEATSFAYSQALNATRLYVPSSTTGPAPGKAAPVPGAYDFTINFTQATENSANIWLFSLQVPITGVRYDLSNGNWKATVAPAGGLSYVLMWAKASPKSVKTPQEIQTAASPIVQAAAAQESATMASVKKAAQQAVDDLGGLQDFTITPTFFFGAAATFGALTNSQSEATGSFTIGPYVGFWKFTVLAGYDLIQKGWVIQFGTQIDSFDVSLGNTPFTRAMNGPRMQQEQVEFKGSLAAQQ